MNRLIHFCLHQKLVVLLLLVFVVGWGVKVAPFDWDTGIIKRDPVPVDAIPDLGDNQQIVFTEFAGRSPQDVEDQITYPLTVSLLGIPGVREVRSFSMFGYSYVYLIFEEDVEFYWSRSRVLEKLNSLPANLLPAGATGRMRPVSAKSTGTCSRGGIRMANPSADGMSTSCARSRTGRCATPC